MSEKKCTSCGETLPISMFGIHAQGATKVIYRPSCKICSNAKNKEWREKNKARLSAYDKARSTKERKDACVAWQKANPEKLREAQRKRYQRNPAKIAAYVAAREAAKKRATPKWLPSNACDWAYCAAAMLKKSYDMPYEVDHIVPLKAKTVCGLHVPWNLVVTLRSENASKGNRWWPDDWRD